MESLLGYLIPSQITPNFTVFIHQGYDFWKHYQKNLSNSNHIYFQSKSQLTQLKLTIMYLYHNP